jgi:antitoxin (DNA-binding transcriptional repressor) of toxin-antitoxin stability system
LKLEQGSDMRSIMEHNENGKGQRITQSLYPAAKWLDAGEEIMITRRGVAIARLVPERERTKRNVDWTKSAAFQLDRLKLRPLTAQESTELLELNRGPY